jgi:L-seryl-tRNA(Ser) seleniumtransferase
VSVDDAVARIRDETALEPRVGVVLGSGLGAFADELDARVEIPYADIPDWPVSTAIGHAGKLVLGTLADIAVAAMCGRAHLYEGIPAERVAFGVRVLARLGVRSLVVTNAAGGINPDFRPGQLVLISDHVNLQGTSSLVGPNDDSLGPRFPDMSDAYDPGLRASAREAAAQLGIEVGKGVYAAWLGPQFETPAEIRFMRAVGGDLAGMSTVQEVIAARHVGIRVLGISVVTNMAAGPAREDRPRGRPRGGSARRGIAHGAPARARSYTLRVKLRDLPSVDELLRDERLAPEPRELALAAARAALERARDDIKAGADPGSVVDAVLAELGRARQPSLRRVLNATGVLVHTNLGRAPLAEAALARVAEVGAGYSNLEYDLERGERGSRQDHLAALLRRLTGAEAALVVNNNAAAVLLALAALAEGREVIVSRGELIEIGDGFRIPDVLVRSGARLVEVGTTNRTRAADYERAIGPETAVLLRVHQSNFRVVGFSERPQLTELADVARAHDLPLVDDLGSGALARVGDEPTPAESLRAGAELVCFSGDKLLGGPQAGVVVGRADHVERLRRHPLQRALRADKLTLAALEGTLALALDPSTRDDVPVLRMLHEPIDVVRARAQRLANLVDGEVEETVARVGGGALPLAELPSAACAVEESLAESLRRSAPPVIALVRDGRTLLDCRTLTDAEVDEVAAAVHAARG